MPVKPTYPLQIKIRRMDNGDYLIISNQNDGDILTFRYGVEEDCRAQAERLIKLLRLA